MPYKRRDASFGTSALCVQVCVHARVCIGCVCSRVFVRVLQARARARALVLCVCLFLRVDVYVRARSLVFTRIGVFAFCVHVCMRLCMRVFFYALFWLRLCTRVCIRVCMRVRVYARLFARLSRKLYARVPVACVCFTCFARLFLRWAIVAPARYQHKVVVRLSLCARTHGDYPPAT